VLRNYGSWAAAGFEDTLLGPQLAADPQQAFPGKGVMKPEQAEIDRLRKEVAKLKMERDILKKAAAFYVR
jgi:transposase